METEEPHEISDFQDEEPVPRRSTRVAVGALLVLLLLVNLATNLYQLPLNRVIERRLCHDYYSKHDPSKFDSDGNVPERLCKIDPVQKGLAWTQGAMDTAWIVGDFVVTIPLGFMAEQYGRRIILWLNLVPRVAMLVWAVLVGCFEQSFSTKAIIAGPFLSVLGGDCVFNSLTYALAASLTDDYVLRATYFGWMSSVSYVGALLGPALAAATMSVMLWFPFFIGIFLLGLAIPIIRLLPDQAGTGSIKDSGRNGDEQSRPLISSPLLKAQGSQPTVASAIGTRFGLLRSMMASHPRNMTLLLVSFFLTSLASYDTKLLPQYISTRYHWSFASAGYLFSCKAIINFTLLTVVVPSLLQTRHTRSSVHHSARETDRSNQRYAIMCLAVSVLGAFGIAVSAQVWLLVVSLLVYALGSVLPVFTLSLLKSPAVAPEREDKAEDSDAEIHIFSIVMMIKTLGSLVGAPVMALIWARGISIGGAALGLPYFTSSAGYAVALFVISKIKT